MKYRVTLTIDDIEEDSEEEAINEFDRLIPKYGYTSYEVEELDD